MGKIFIMAMLFVNLTTFGQNNVRDSISGLLAQKLPDTSRVLLLAELSFLSVSSMPDTAAILALQGLELSRRVGFEKGEALCLSRIGNYYHNTGNWSKAVDYQLQSLKINERIREIDGIHRSLNNIGINYLKREDYRIALDYFFKALPLTEQMNNLLSRGSVLNNIGESYLKLKMYDSAAFYSQQAYFNAIKTKNDRVVGASMRVLGRIDFETENYLIALERYRKSYPFLYASQSLNGLSRAYLEAANVFQKLDQSDSVRFYGMLALTIARDKGFLLEQRDAARFLSYFYRKYNADSAFFYQDVSKALNDSLFSQEKERNMVSLQVDEMIRQQEIASKKLQEEEDRKHNLQYAAIVLALVVFLTLFFAFSHSVIANQKLIRFLGILSLLIVFEFINLFIHPFLDKWTNHSIPMMLGIMVCIAALLIPLHHKLEHWITHRLVEKNNKIRLTAAKRTIEQLERSTNAQQQL